MQGKVCTVFICVPACVLGVTQTLPITPEAIVSFRTQSGVACLPCVSWFTQTLPVGVVAFAIVLTATLLCTAGTVGANWTMVLTPVHSRDTTASVSDFKK